MKKRIVFCDVDGTLLNSKHQISPLTQKAILTLQEKEIPFVISSGRCPRGVYPLLEKCGFKGPIISYSGSLILDENREVISHQGISKSLAEEVITFLEEKKFDLVWGIYSKEQWVVKNRKDPRVIKEEALLQANAEEGDIHTIQDDIVNKIMCICNPEEIDGIEMQVEEKFPNCQVIKSGDIWLEVMGLGISKADAVKKLCEINGANPEDAIAFGDNYNDWEMIHAVGCGYLMGNAPKALLEQAKEITEDNDHDGIYHALERLAIVP